MRNPPPARSDCRQLTRIVVVLALLQLAACKSKGLAPLPPERDPTAEQAPMTEYRPLPDVLTTELSSGAAASAAAEPAADPKDPKPSHDMGSMGEPPASNPQSDDGGGVP